MIVPRASLLRQWQDQLLRFLEIVDNRPPLLTKSGNKSKRKRPIVGQIGSGKEQISDLVDVATYQSLVRKNRDGIPEVKSLVSNYSLVICDECHHVGALNLERVMKHVNARWVYGLTATPKRADGMQKIVYFQCGPIRASVSPQEQIDGQRFERVLIPRFTNIRLPLTERRESYSGTVTRLCTHSFRNQLIVDDTIKAIESNRHPLVITNRVEHAKNLAELIRDAGCRAFLITGSGTTKEKSETLENLKKAEGRFAVVSTGSYIGEGFDLPTLDTLILAAPYKWEGLITQYSGRLHRDVEGKTDVRIFDYVDLSIPFLERMYKNRLKTYGKLGYRIEGEGVDIAGASAFVRSDKAIKLLSNGIDAARDSVLISSSYLGPKHATSLERCLRAAVERGLTIRIVSQAPKSDDARARFETYVSQYRACGCGVIVSSSFCHNIVIIDGETCWYGTLPPLANGNTDDCSIVLKDAEVAFELKRLVDESTAG